MINDALSQTDLMVFLGLESASSLTRVTVIEDMWSSRMLVRLSEYQEVMSQNMYKRIRSALRVYPFYEHDVAVKVPLWPIE